MTYRDFATHFQLAEHSWECMLSRSFLGQANHLRKNPMSMEFRVYGLRGKHAMCMQFIV